MARAHIVNTDNHVNPSVYQTKATSKGCGREKCTQKSSKLDFPGFCECVCTCCMALGFEMFLSEL